MSCIEHTGMTTRLNLNLGANALGLLLLSIILSVAVNINGSVSTNALEIGQLKESVKELKEETELMETRIWLIENGRAPVSRPDSPNMKGPANGR